VAGRNRVRQDVGARCDHFHHHGAFCELAQGEFQVSRGHSVLVAIRHGLLSPFSRTARRLNDKTYETTESVAEM
jgi:hypothetical protein